VSADTLCVVENECFDQSAEGYLTELEMMVKFPLGNFLMMGMGCHETPLLCF